MWAPTTPISTSLAVVFNNATRANASSSSLGSTSGSSCGGVVGSPLSARVAGGGAVAAGAAGAAAADGGGGWVRGLILGLLGAELAYIILDRLGQLAAAHRGKVCMGCMWMCLDVCLEGCGYSRLASVWLAGQDGYTHIMA